MPACVYRALGPATALIGRSDPQYDWRPTHSACRTAPLGVLTVITGEAPLEHYAYIAGQLAAMAPVGKSPFVVLYALVGNDYAGWGSRSWWSLVVYCQD